MTTISASTLKDGIIALNPPWQISTRRTEVVG
jgi:hypothetical protein